MIRKIILTHGYGESKESWSDQVLDLDGRFDLQTWDLPGHGVRSPLEHLDTDIDAPTAELVALIEQASSPPMLVGHSIGGYLTLRASLMTAAPISGLVLISTGPGFADPDRMRDWNKLVDTLTATMALTPATGRMVHMKDSFVVDSLPTLSVPVLLIVGREDRRVYQLGSQYLAKTLPHAELLEVVGAEHEPHRTHAAEVNAAIRSFASRLPWPRVEPEPERSRSPR